MKDLKYQFQTPMPVAEYMASLMPYDINSCLEPTPGIGNLVRAIELEDSSRRRHMNENVTAPKDFFKLKRKRFDCVIMNPPFSEKHAFGIPDGLDLKGMRLGYYMLLECMKKSDNVIALMPWFTIIDSDVRLKTLENFGLKSITALPRKTFEYSRIQTCVIELEKDYKGETMFKSFRY